MCNLRIILRSEEKEEVLDTALPEEPVDNATTAERAAYRKVVDNDREVSYIMLTCMEPELQM